ncbi:unnamed protein product [Cylicocyclus nassatus]|uniref:Uncharacterized protein n=1 Tax=Cylicocyclus nassatus TaxID=53992 RepID=A0AA36M0Q4_CYLNA|nr:unnamed protein product [Cylicocyclus nassatus]
MSAIDAEGHLHQSVANAEMVFPVETALIVEDWDTRRDNAQAVNGRGTEFAETLLALNNPDLVPVRYLSDSAASDNTNLAPVDLNTLLTNLEAEHGGQMTEEDINLCRDYRDGRRVIERYLQDSDQVLQMTEEDKEEYLLSRGSSP